MSIGSRIKECREQVGITQEELAKLLGVSKGAIGNYEAGISYPKIENMTKLFKILKTDANYLFQDETNSNSKDMFNESEKKHIQKYRILDNHGKELVNSILDIEYQRCSQSETQTAVDKLLGIEQTEEKVHKIKIAARNGDNKEITLTDSELQSIISGEKPTDFD